MTMTIDDMIRILSVRHPQYGFGYEVGRRYDKIWKRLGAQTSRSIVCFVDRTTGLVYRAESWTKPGRLISSIDGVVVM